jgi:hypothetical protein
LETIFSESGACMLDGSGTKRVQEYIQKEFAKARSMPVVSTYMKPGGVDKAQVVDTAVERFKKMIEAAADPEVEVIDLEPENNAPLVPLAHQAKPLLEQLTPQVAPVHHKRRVYWVVGEIKESAEQLAAAAIKSLDKKPMISPDDLKCNLDASEKKSWFKKIF